jgi:hypothetical protein
MVTYDVTGTEAKGFQVSVTGSSGTNLIGDFSTLQEAEAFADQMRVIDADRPHSTPAPPQNRSDQKSHPSPKFFATDG